MNMTTPNSILAAAIIAVLPSLAAAHDGPHGGVTVAGLNYQEIYREKVKGGAEIATKSTALDGNMKFAVCPAGTSCGISELNASTPWSVYANGTLLAQGTLGDDPKAKFSPKKGKANINLSAGKLKVTWDNKFIKFNLKWSGDALLAKSYIDTAQPKLNVPGGAQFDVQVGETRALFDTPAKGSAKVKKKGAMLLSDIILSGKAKSSGDPSAVDRDGDGYSNDVEASLDATCDYDATRNTGAEEKRLDGIDSDCDGRDSDLPEALDTYQGNTTAFSSPTVPYNEGQGARDYTGWNKTFEYPAVGKVSFYDPTTGNSYNDYTAVPASDGQGIWRAWTHTGKWGYFYGKAGDKIKIKAEKGSAVTAPGSHPAFIVFWRPEGAPLNWEGTQDIAVGGKLGAAVDIVPAHNVPQKADWTINGLPEKADHVMPEGIDTTLYPSPSNGYTLYHVAAAWDKDLYVPTNKFVMHPTALNDLAISDGVPGVVEKTITLPKDGYYMMQVTNVLEVEDWAVCEAGDTREICTNASSSSTSPGAGHGGSSKTGLGLKNELNPTTADKTSVNNIDVTISPGAEASLAIDPGPQGDGAKGIHYHYIINGFSAGQSTTIYGHDNKFPDAMSPGSYIWGVGALSWCQAGTCSGGGGESLGWNHTGVHVGFELAEAAKVTIEMSNATPTTASASWAAGPIPLGNDLKPGFSLYSGKGTTGINDSNHTFQNQVNISWTNTTGIVGWKDAGDANTVSGTYDLQPGFYTLYIGGNYRNVLNNDATLAGSTDRNVTRAPKDPANPGPCEGTHLAGCGGTEKDFKLVISATNS